MNSSHRRSKKVTVGMVTIGESPRTDVTSDITELLGEGIEIVECGALDGLSKDQIAELQPSDADEVLVSRLRNGTEVKLAHEKLIVLVQDCVNKLEAKCDVVTLLCTGEFPEIHSKRILVRPSELLSHLVRSLLPTGTLGILIPSPEQERTVRPKWEKQGYRVVIEPLSPYQQTERKKVVEVASRLKEKSVDLVVLDCIGYSIAMSSVVKQTTGAPVLLSRSLVARILRDIL